MENQILRGGAETLKKTHKVVLESHGDMNHQLAVEHLQHADFSIDFDQFRAGTGLIFATRNEERSTGTMLDQHEGESDSV